MSKNNSLQWELDERGVLAVSVKGHMPDYYEHKNPAPWHEVRDRIDTIIFREGIKSIGAQAFKDCKALTYVEIPESLERIGYGAFEGCVSLDFVDFPEKRTLKHQQSPNQEVKISQKKVVMERRAFLFTPWAKEEMGDFIVEDGLLIEYYGEEEEVKIPEGIEKINSFVFRKHGIKSVAFPKSLKVIGEFAFEATSLFEIFLPEGIEAIHMGAFSNISTLEKVYIENPDIILSKEVFSGCGKELVVEGHNPSAARTYCQKNGITYRTNHKPVERFKVIPLAEGKPDYDFLMKRMGQRYIALAVMVNEKTKTVEMVKSHRIGMIPILEDDTYFYFDGKGLRARMLVEYVLYPEKDMPEVQEWYYTVNKKSSYCAYAGEAYYEQYKGKGKSKEDCRYEWFFSWEVNKWRGRLETAFLQDWLTKHPEYSLFTGIPEA